MMMMMMMMIIKLEETGCLVFLQACPGTEQFKIRLIQTEKEFESIIINAMVKETWEPGLQDAGCFITCDPTAGFVGELNGKPIGDLHDGVI